MTGLLGTLEEQILCVAAIMEPGGAAPTIWECSVDTAILEYGVLWLCPQKSFTFCGFVAIKIKRFGAACDAFSSSFVFFCSSQQWRSP